MEALRERYARGELSDEEFEQKKKVLQNRMK
jgi:putative membrane protein